ncbi:hypothetical protein B5S32_g1231 [[Candida] boidinii]|nr:hypothetical protein B5S32_g1231 [[Candida] boidinii]
MTLKRSLSSKLKSTIDKTKRQLKDTLKKSNSSNSIRSSSNSINNINFHNSGNSEYNDKTDNFSELETNNLIQSSISLCSPKLKQDQDQFHIQYPSTHEDLFDEDSGDETKDYNILEYSITDNNTTNNNNSENDQNASMTPPGSDIDYFSPKGSTLVLPTFSDSVKSPSIMQQIFTNSNNTSSMSPTIPTSGYNNNIEIVNPRNSISSSNSNSRQHKASVTSLHNHSNSISSKNSSIQISTKNSQILQTAFNDKRSSSVSDESNTPLINNNKSTPISVNTSTGNINLTAIDPNGGNGLGLSSPTGNLIRSHSVISNGSHRKSLSISRISRPSTPKNLNSQDSQNDIIANTTSPLNQMQIPTPTSGVILLPDNRLDESIPPCAIEDSHMDIPITLSDLQSITLSSSNVNSNNNSSLNTNIINSNNNSNNNSSLVDGNIGVSRPSSRSSSLTTNMFANNSNNANNNSDIGSVSCLTSPNIDSPLVKNTSNFTSQHIISPLAASFSQQQQQPQQEQDQQMQDFTLYEEMNSSEQHVPDLTEINKINGVRVSSKSISTFESNISNSSTSAPFTQTVSSTATSFVIIAPVTLNDGNINSKGSSALLPTIPDTEYDDSKTITSAKTAIYSNSQLGEDINDAMNDKESYHDSQMKQMADQKYLEEEESELHDKDDISAADNDDFNLADTSMATITSENVLPPSSIRIDETDNNILNNLDRPSLAGPSTSDMTDSTTAASTPSSSTTPPTTPFSSGTADSSTINNNNNGSILIHKNSIISLTNQDNPDLVIKCSQSKEELIDSNPPEFKSNNPSSIFTKTKQIDHFDKNLSAKKNDELAEVMALNILDQIDENQNENYFDYEFNNNSKSVNNNIINGKFGELATFKKESLLRSKSIFKKFK